MNDHNFEDLEVGKIFEFLRTISTEDVDNFSKLTGDFNSLHNDQEYAETTEFKGRIAHGMLVGSLFSTLFGMVCPGKRNLYLSQNLNFRKPVPLNSTVIVRGKIKNKIESLKILVVETEILLNNEVVVNGEAKIKVI
jgi:3-hydroxybutyryl-CoA dehydratase